MHLQCLLLTVFIGFVYGIPVIEVKGRHFAQKGNDSAFFVKGLAYQPGGAAGINKGSDPLSDPELCRRDVFVFQSLGINTIRVYGVDPDVNHDACMSLLAAAGIYVILDVTSPLSGEHLHRYQPWTTYAPPLMKRIFKVMEVFSGYDNSLGFIALNEVVNDEKSAENAPNYIKALVRDMRAYAKNHIHREIPIGYAAADVLEYQQSLSSYLQCGEEGYVDFVGINTYRWCGDADYESSLYWQLVDDYKNFSVPLVISEHGCNRVQPRKWNEIAAILGPKMCDVFSGGVAYEYTMEKQADGQYGVVQVNGTSLKYLPGEFAALSKAYLKSPSPNVQVKESRLAKRPECPPSFDKIANKPIPSSQSKDLINEGLHGKDFKRGRFIPVDRWETTRYTIDDAKGARVLSAKIKQVASLEQGAISENGYDPQPGLSKDVDGSEEPTATTTKGDAPSKTTDATAQSSSGAASQHLPSSLFSTFFGMLGLLLIG